MNIVEIINQALDELSQPNIKTIETTSDATAILMRALASKMANEITVDYKWSKLTKFYSFEMLQGVQDYDLSLIEDYSNIESVYLWDATNNIKMQQASLDRELYNKVNAVTDVFRKFIFTDGKIRFTSAFDSDTTVYMYYFDRNSVKRTTPAEIEGDPDVITYHRRFNTDTDTFLLDDMLLVQALVASFKEKNQLSGWQNEQSQYIDLLNREKDKDAKSFVVNFGNPDSPYKSEDNGYLFT